MSQLAPMFASEGTAAKLLDMKVKDFRAMVDAGVLPGPIRLAEMERWDMEALRRIVRGDAVNGMEDVKW